jgi:hypothetical protein
MEVDIFQFTAYSGLPTILSTIDPSCGANPVRRIFQNILIGYISFLNTTQCSLPHIFGFPAIHSTRNSLAASSKKLVNSNIDAGFQRRDSGQYFYMKH